MPVTPLHFGLMAPINHFAPKRVSLVSFVIVNLLIDLEAINAVLMGDDLLPSHDRPSHNLWGAAVIFALVAVVRLRSGPWKWGALLGCLSHLILDGMVHPEMQPFAPYVAGNPIYLGAIEPLSWALLPLTGWLTAQCVSAIGAWARLRRSGTPVPATAAPLPAPDVDAGRLRSRDHSLGRKLLRAFASVALGLGKLVAAVLILEFAVLYPIQRDYYRGQGVRDAFVYGQRVAGFVSRYRATEQRLPERLSDLGLPFEQPEQVSSIQLDPSSGSLRIRVANEPDGKETLELVAALNRDGELAHTCRSVNIPDGLMPRDCVRQQLESALR